MTKKYEVRYSFSIYVDAEDYQEAIDIANEKAKNIEQYGPNCVDTIENISIKNPHLCGAKANR